MISARALCFDMKPNLCLLRLSSTQHNAPEFHDTKEIEFKARGGPALLGMPKLYEEPCGNTLVPSSHSNCHKAYVSGSSGARKEVLCPLHQRKKGYIYGRYSISEAVGLWPALVQLSPSPSPLPQRPLREGRPCFVDPGSASSVPDQAHPSHNSGEGTYNLLFSYKDAPSRKTYVTRRQTGSYEPTQGSLD